MDNQFMRDNDDFILIRPEASSVKNYSRLPYPNNLISKILQRQTVATEYQVKGLECALSLLPEEDQLLLQRHFKNKVILDVLATERGVTRARVMQIINRTLEKLRGFPLGPYIDKGFLEYDEYYKNAMNNLTKLASLTAEENPAIKQELITAVKDLDIGFLGLSHCAQHKTTYYAKCFTIGELIELCSKTGGDYDKYGWNFSVRWAGVKYREEIEEKMRRYNLID